MHIQQALRKNAVLRKHFIGAHPIIQWFIERLQIREIVGSYIGQDGRAALSLEKTLGVLIHNILTSPMPMYEIADWALPLSSESLGLEQEDMVLLNDDRIGKGLDAFYEGRHKDVFFRLALRAIRVFGLDCSQIHQDTTTITFPGRYENWTASERLAHGHNKDHRPDLKQLVLGLSVTADGAVPLVHQVYDGNQTDDRLHPANHQRIAKLLGRTDFTYVTDCKLVTDDNLKKIVGSGGFFVSVMPRTWKEDKEFRELVKAGKIQWELLLSRRNNRKPHSGIDRYYLAVGQFVTSRGYRLLWILSTQKKEQDAITRQSQIEKALEALREIQSGLNRYSLRKRKDIKRAVKKALKDCQCQRRIIWKIHSYQLRRQIHRHRGRPKAGAQVQETWKKQYSLSFELDEKILQEEKTTDGIFPMITNHLAETHSPRRVLEVYKFQPFLEKRHSQIKTWQEITPVLLKKSERVVAYLHVHVMALMVSTLIERTLRKAMATQKIPSLPLYPEGRACKHPTSFDITRLFKNAERYEVEGNDGTTLFPAELTPLQKQILQLLEVPVSRYH